MTKKHFIALAETIKSKFQLDRPWAEVPAVVQASALDAADVICQVASQDNPRFDRERFLAACGLFAK